MDHRGVDICVAGQVPDRACTKACPSGNLSGNWSIPLALFPAWPGASLAQFHLPELVADFIPE